jgi:hypothetical protein
MIIPSLRSLGFIVGHAEAIKLSSNGMLIVKGWETNKELYGRIWRTIIYELDLAVFQFIKVLLESHIMEKEKYKHTLSLHIKSPNERQRKERISHWLSILEQIDFVKLNSKVSLVRKNLALAEKDANYQNKDMMEFKKYFFKAYQELSASTAGIVDIVNLREKTALLFLKRKKILTEKQFDDLLRKLPFVTGEYVISLGSPMTGGKLFEYEGSKYRTIMVRT